MVEAEEGGGLVRRACVMRVVVVCLRREDGNPALGFSFSREDMDNVGMVGWTWARTRLVCWYCGVRVLQLSRLCGARRGVAKKVLRATIIGAKEKNKLSYMR